MKCMYVTPRTGRLLLVWTLMVNLSDTGDSTRRNKSPVSLALRFIETHKPLRHGKVVMTHGDPPSVILKIQWSFPPSPKKQNPPPTPQAINDDRSLTLIFTIGWFFYMYNQKIIKVREWIPLIGPLTKLIRLKVRIHGAILRAIAELHRVSTPKFVARNIAAVESGPTSATLRATNFFVYSPSAVFRAIVWRKFQCSANQISHSNLSADLIFARGTFHVKRWFGLQKRKVL